MTDHLTHIKTTEWQALLVDIGRATASVDFVVRERDDLLRKNEALQAENKELESCRERFNEWVSRMTERGMFSPGAQSSDFYFMVWQKAHADALKEFSVENVSWRADVERWQQICREDTEHRNTLLAEIKALRTELDRVMKIAINGP